MANHAVVLPHYVQALLFVLWACEGPHPTWPEFLCVQYPHYRCIPVMLPQQHAHPPIHQQPLLGDARRLAMRRVGG